MQKITLLMLLLTHLSYWCQAQISNLVGMIGEPIREMRYSNIEGTPYLTETFNKGYVLMKDNRRGEFDLKYDTFADKLLYLHNNQMYELDNTEVREFGYTTTANKKKQVFRNGFGSYVPYNDNTFFEILHEGKTKLLKKYTASKMTTKLYNSATSTTSFEIGESLFIYINQELKPLKKGKKNFYALVNYQEAVVKFIENKKIKLKTEQEIIEVLQYMDSL